MMHSARSDLVTQMALIGQKLLCCDKTAQTLKSMYADGECSCHCFSFASQNLHPNYLSYLILYTCALRVFEYMLNCFFTDNRCSVVINTLVNVLSI